MTSKDCVASQRICKWTAQIKDLVSDRPCRFLVVVRFESFSPGWILETAVFQGCSVLAWAMQGLLHTSLSVCLSSMHLSTCVCVPSCYSMGVGVHLCVKGREVR